MRIATGGFPLPDDWADLSVDKPTQRITKEDLIFVQVKVHGSTHSRYDFSGPSSTHLALAPEIVGDTSIGAYADRREPVSRLSLAHLVRQRRQDSRSRRDHRMS